MWYFTLNEHLSKNNTINFKKEPSKMALTINNYFSWKKCTLSKKSMDIKIKLVFYLVRLNLGIELDRNT